MSTSTAGPAPAPAVGVVLPVPPDVALPPDSAERLLRTAGLEVATPAEALARARERGRPLLLHDPLCLATPAAWLADAAAAVAPGEVLVGVRPVTDTVKVVADGRVGRTVDRERLASMATPVVLAADVVVEVAGSGEVADDLLGPAGGLAVLVERLAGRHRLRLVEAPVLARRVDDRDTLTLLEALAARPVSG